MKTHLRLCPALRLAWLVLSLMAWLQTANAAGLAKPTIYAFNVAAETTINRGQTATLNWSVSSGATVTLYQGVGLDDEHVQGVGAQSVGVQSEGVLGDCVQSVGALGEGVQGEGLDGAKKLEQLTTGNYGDFKFDRLKPNSGPYTVHIDLPGHQPRILQANLENDSLNLGVVELEEASAVASV